MRMTHPRRLVCVWLLGALLLPVRTWGDAGVPRAVVDAPVHDFGAVEQGAIVEHVFRVRNTGTGALRVDHVKGTCACTVGAATGEPIAPGGEAWVTMRLETDRLTGRTTKTATVYTNDPASPTLPVTLTGQVLSDLVVKPTPIYLGRVRQGEVVRREIAVASGRVGGTATVVGVETQSPRIRAWVEAGAAGEGQRVVVEVDTRASSGRFSDDVVQRTTSTQQPAMTVKVLGTIDAAPQG